MVRTLHFKNSVTPGPNETIESFVKKLIEMREKVRHFREDDLDESELLQRIFLYPELDRELAKQLVDSTYHIPTAFNARFYDDVTLEVDADSTEDSLVAQYKEKQKETKEKEN